MRHDLPGGWVEIRDSSELTERQARPVRKAYSTFASSLSRAIGPDVDTDKITEADIIALVGDDYLDNRDAYEDALIVAYVSEWSWTEAPSEAADVLPISDYATLAGLCEAADRAKPNLGPDGASDPKVPTEISTDSEQP